MNSRPGDLKLDFNDIKNVAIAYLNFTEQHHDYGYTNNDAIQEILKNVRGNISKASNYNTLLKTIIHIREEGEAAENLKSNVGKWIFSLVKKPESSYTKKELNALASMILFLRIYSADFKEVYNAEINNITTKILSKEMEKTSASNAYRGEVVTALNQEIKELVIKGAMLSHTSLIEKADTANYISDRYFSDPSLKDYLSNENCAPVGSLLLYDFFGKDFYETLVADRAKSRHSKQPRYFDEFVKESAESSRSRISHVNNASETQPPGAPVNASETQPPGAPLNASETQPPGATVNASETQPPGAPINASETQPPGASGVYSNLSANLLFTKAPAPVPHDIAFSGQSNQKQSRSVAVPKK